jgi:uncharacterized membrane protein
MSESKRTWSDEQVERFLGNLLWAGVILAAVIVLIGGSLYLIQYGTAGTRENRVFHGEPPELLSPRAIIADACTGDSRGIIQLGLLVLIATPVARVVFSVIAFVLERDRLYIALTLIVLIVLLFSLVGGQLK